jgi:hypothetical protein
LLPGIVQEESAIQPIPVLQAQPATILKLDHVNLDSQIEATQLESDAEPMATQLDTQTTFAASQIEDEASSTLACKLPSLDQDYMHFNDLSKSHRLIRYIHL